MLSVSLSFCLVCLVSYKRPIITSHIFATSLSLRKRLRDFLKYQRALHAIDGRHFDATAEQIGEANVCSICHERMWPWQQDYAAKRLNPTGDGETPQYAQSEMSRTKRLPCGHLFHLGCLQQWFEKQAVCPLCRVTVYIN